MHARDERTDRRREAEAREHLFRARRLARNDTRGDFGSPEGTSYVAPAGNEATGSGSPLERATQRTPASR
jgi:hypothetical protein